MHHVGRRSRRSAVCALTGVLLLLAGCGSSEQAGATGQAGQGGGAQVDAGAVNQPVPGPVPGPGIESPPPEPPLPDSSAIPTAPACPPGTDELQLIHESYLENLLAPSIRACWQSDPPAVLLRNAGPMVWIIDRPYLPPQGRRYLEPSDLVAQAVLEQLGSDPAGVPLLPEQDFSVYGAAPEQVHFTPDPRWNAMWVQAVNVSAALPDEVLDPLTDMKGRKGVIAQCALSTGEMVRSMPPVQQLDPDALFTAGVTQADCVEKVREYRNARREAARAAGRAGDEIVELGAHLPSASRPTIVTSQRSVLQAAKQFVAKALVIYVRS